MEAAVLQTVEPPTPQPDGRRRGAMAGAVHMRVVLSRLAPWVLLVFGSSHLAGGMVPTVGVWTARRVRTQR